MRLADRENSIEAKSRRLRIKLNRSLSFKIATNAPEFIRYILRSFHARHSGSVSENDSVVSGGHDYGNGVRCGPEAGTDVVAAIGHHRAEAAKNIQLLRSHARSLAGAQCRRSRATRHIANAASRVSPGADGSLACYRH